MCDSKRIPRDFQILFIRGILRVYVMGTKKKGKKERKNAFGRNKETKKEKTLTHQRAYTALLELSLQIALISKCNTLQHNATQCNTLQHTATHCNTLQHTATHCNTL